MQPKLCDIVVSRLIYLISSLAISRYLIWMCADRSSRFRYGPRQRHRRQRPHSGRVLWRVRAQADNARPSVRPPGRRPHAAPHVGVAHAPVRVRPAVSLRRGPLALHAGHHDGRGAREALLQVTRGGASWHLIRNAKVSQSKGIRDTEPQNVKIFKLVLGSLINWSLLITYC